MGVYGFTSFTGSPGVTTTCVALATVSTSPVLLVEADMTGGSAVLAGRFAAAQPHDRSVLWLADQVTNPDRFADHVWEQSLPMPGSEHARFVPGISAPAQARSLSRAWSGIGAGLSALSQSTGQDVIVDLGRWTTAAAPRALVEHLDALLVLTDARLPSLNATRHGVVSIADEFGAGVQTRTAVSVLQRQWSWRREDRAGFRVRPYRVREVRSMVTPCPVLTAIPYRPVDAAVYSDRGELTRWHDHSGYVRAIRSLHADLTEHAERATRTFGPRSS